MKWLIPKRYVLAFLVFGVSLFVMTQAVFSAQSTDLRVRILPKDCVFDVVNTGTQELVFYTPAACGVPIDPNNPVEPPPTPAQPTNVQPQRPTPRPDLLQPPVVDPNAGGVTIIGNQITLQGTTTPNAQVNIYADGKIAGSTFADSNGAWTFVYIATSSPVIFRLEACVASNCSILGDSILVEVDLGACSIAFELLQYRFSNVITDSPIQLDVSQTSGDGILSINWGYENYEERFDHNADRPTPYNKSYDEKGSYNGVIKFQQENCEKIRYFSVSVSDSSRPNNLIAILWLLALAGGLVMLNYIVSKDKQNTVQKK